jgi:hypothetical protein
MGIIFMVVGVAILGAVYVLFLRLSARWTLKTTVSRKLCWAAVAGAVAITACGLLIAETIGGRGILMVVHPVAQLLFGGWFFGRFARTPNNLAPGFVGGLKMTGAALAMLVVVLGLMASLPQWFPRD